MNKLELIADGFIDDGDLDEDSMRKHLSNLEYEVIIALQYIKPTYCQQSFSLNSHRPYLRESNGDSLM